MPSDRHPSLRMMMQAAAGEGVLIPAFNVPYLPMAKPICQAVSALGAFCLVEVARLELLKFEARSAAAVAAEYRRWADRRVTALHLDHVPVIDEDGLTVDWRGLIADGIANGYDSVMVDGSRLPLDDNIAVTAEVVRTAHAQGVLVEAELGSVPGHEDGPMPPYAELFASRRGFTDPSDARRFVAETGVDWLSVSVGSFHGAIAPATKDRAKTPAKLDVRRVRELRAATGIPLVLHGGSGVIQAYLDRAAAEGMVKVNVGTEVRQVYERTLAASADVDEAQEAVGEAVRRLIVEVYRAEGSASRLAGVAGIAGA